MRLSCQKIRTLHITENKYGPKENSSPFAYFDIYFSKLRGYILNILKSQYFQTSLKKKWILWEVILPEQGHYMLLKINPVLGKRVAFFPLLWYIFLNVPSLDGSHHHGHGLRGGEPVWVVIPLREVTNIVQVAEEVWHCAELPEATSWGTWAKKTRFHAWQLLS